MCYLKTEYMLDMLFKIKIPNILSKLNVLSKLNILNVSSKLNIYIFKIKILNILFILNISFNIFAHFGLHFTIIICLQCFGFQFLLSNKTTIESKLPCSPQNNVKIFVLLNSFQADFPCIYQVHKVQSHIPEIIEQNIQRGHCQR